MAVALLLPEQVASLLGVTVETLKSWRYQGTGPAFVKLNRLVRYEPDAIEAFIEARRPKSNVTPLRRSRSA